MYQYRILAAGLLYFFTTASAVAAYTPLYAGFQIDNGSGTAMLGYRLNKQYAVEAHAARAETKIDQAGASSSTKSTAFGVTGLFFYPLKFTGGSPYLLFAKAGYQRINKNVSYSFPSSVTYSGSYKNTENKAIVGAGAQYDFYENFNGRVGVDVVDKNRSVYLGVIFKF